MEMLRDGVGGVSAAMVCNGNCCCCSEISNKDRRSLSNRAGGGGVCWESLGRGVVKECFVRDSKEGARWAVSIQVQASRIVGEP